MADASGIEAAKNRALEIDAAEIRMRAERRLGELITAQKATVGLNPGSRGQLVSRGVIGGSKTEPPIPTLASVSIDKKLSSRAQKLAAVPEAQFEGMMGEWRERVSDETERVTTNLLRAAQREEEWAALIAAAAERLRTSRSCGPRRARRATARA